MTTLNDKQPATIEEAAALNFVGFPEDMTDKEVATACKEISEFIHSMTFLTTVLLWRDKDALVSLIRKDAATNADGNPVAFMEFSENLARVQDTIKDLQNDFERAECRLLVALSTFSLDPSVDGHNQQ